MKFAFISHILPPEWGGQAIVIHRLLGAFDPDSYCLVSRTDYAPDAFRGNYSRRLPARYYHLPPEPLISRGNRFGLAKIRESINVPLAVIARARRVVKIIRKENCSKVIACTGDIKDLPAGYLASLWTRLPFYAYIFDYYSYQSLNPLERFYARLFEPVILKGATGIIAPNEILRDELKKRHGVAATVIYNPCDISEYKMLSDQVRAENNGEIRIVYTGAIYEAHFDAFRNLIAAIKLLGRPNLKLHLYSASPVDWERERITGPIVHHAHQEMSTIPAIQRQADILFLPLAFRSPYPLLIKTSATSKLAEYLAARSPVLVHAPSDSFVSWYFRRHDCGLVVDERDPAKLAEAVERLISDENLRSRLSANAWMCAQKDFSVAKSQVRFATLLGVPMAMPVYDDTDGYTELRTASS